jgi:oligopeptide transport system permease protein
VCVPAFVLGPVLIILFAVKLQLFPVGLWESSLHILLPAITLGLFFGGKVARLMREGMISALRSEFIVTARAKGLTEFGIWFKHGFRVAILPVVTYSGPMLADLLTGSFVVENLFQIPGMGIFMVNSSLNRDYTMVVGLVLVYAVILLLLNVIVDWLYARLDPRIKLA